MSETIRRWVETCNIHILNKNITEKASYNFRQFTNVRGPVAHYNDTFDEG